MTCPTCEGGGKVLVIRLYHSREPTGVVLPARQVRLKHGPDTIEPCPACTEKSPVFEGEGE